MKKAQDFSLKTIVIAALLLLVMIVIIFIFTGKIQIFTRGTRSCESQKGECLSDGDCPLTEYIRIPGTNCEDNGEKCCVKIIDTGS
jgi:hypothetical protein